MSKDPAFLFYSRDFYEGTRNMLPEERACYIDLMIYQHQNKIIPLDLKRVYMYCSGISKETIDYVITEKFIKTDFGYYNEKLTDVVNNREKHSEKQSINGRLGQFYKQAKKLMYETDYFNLKQHLSKHSNEQALSIVNDFFKLGLKDSFNLDEAKLEALLKHLAIAIIDNNIYKKIEIEKLKILGLSDSVWLDSICELHKLERNKITFGLNEFCLHLKAQGETEKTLKDFKVHFSNWVRVKKQYQVKTENKDRL